jgi:hypothetical protein
MRTVAFANEKVIELVNSTFVAVWHNQNPRDARPAGAAQPVYTPEELELYPEGGGGTNVLTYFCDGQGRVLHLVTGWWRAERFMEELKAAEALSHAGDNLQELANIHTLHKNAHAAEAERLAKEHPEEMNKPHHESKIRRLHAALGLQANMHETAAGMLFRNIVDILRQLEYQHEERGAIK